MIVFLSLSSASAQCHTDVIGVMQEAKLLSRFQSCPRSIAEYFRIPVPQSR